MPQLYGINKMTLLGEVLEVYQNKRNASDGTTFFATRLLIEVREKNTHPNAKDKETITKLMVAVNSNKENLQLSHGSKGEYVYAEGRLRYYKDEAKDQFILSIQARESDVRLMVKHEFGAGHPTQQMQQVQESSSQQSPSDFTPF